MDHQSRSIRSSNNRTNISGTTVNSSTAPVMKVRSNSFGQNERMGVYLNGNNDAGNYRNNNNTVNGSIPKNSRQWQQPSQPSTTNTTTHYNTAPRQQLHRRSLSNSTISISLEHLNQHINPNHQQTYQKQQQHHQHHQQQQYPQYQQPVSRTPIISTSTQQKRYGDRVADYTGDDVGVSLSGTLSGLNGGWTTQHENTTLQQQQQQQQQHPAVHQTPHKNTNINNYINVNKSLSKSTGKTHIKNSNGPSGAGRPQSHRRSLSTTAAVRSSPATQQISQQQAVQNHVSSSQSATKPQANTATRRSLNSNNNHNNNRPSITTTTTTSSLSVPFPIPPNSSNNNINLFPFPPRPVSPLTQVSVVSALNTAEERKQEQQDDNNKINNNNHNNTTTHYHHYYSKTTPASRESRPLVNPLQKSHSQVSGISSLFGDSNFSDSTLDRVTTRNTLLNEKPKAPVALPNPSLSIPIAPNYLCEKQQQQQQQPQLHPLTTLSSSPHPNHIQSTQGNRPTHKRALSAQLPNQTLPITTQSLEVPQTTLPDASTQVVPVKRSKTPARFSSNGIATSKTPPPSLAYRFIPEQKPPEQKRPPPPTVESDSEDEDMTTDYERRRQDLRVRREDRYGGVSLNTEDEPTIRQHERLAPTRSFNLTPERPQQPQPQLQEETPPKEDLFLNLARSNTPKSQTQDARSEKRRSRLLGYNRTGQEYSPPVRKMSDQYNESSVSPVNGYENESNHVSFLKRQRDPREARSPAGYPRAQERTIGSMIDADRAQNNDRLGVNSVNDSASVVSAAPSVVWDELIELKTRIKRLELTNGKNPSSNPASGVSNSSGDRPHTGTTTVTTISTSPRNKAQPEPEPAEPPSPIHSTHPLLHSALNKSRTVLPIEITKALEAVASDALSIAQLVGSTGNPQTSGVNATMNHERGIATDRQVRRKVDSMCRSLTELCIALSDGRMPLEEEPQNKQLHTPFQSPMAISRADPIERAATSLDYRRADRERSHTPSSASKYARYDRRASLVSNSPGSALLSRAEVSPSPVPPVPRLPNRNSMLLRQQRASMGGPDLGGNSLDVDDPGLRAPSRASTDLGTLAASLNNSSRPSPLQDFNSTNNIHNMPLSPRLQHLSPVSLPHRRQFSTNSYSPRYRTLQAQATESPAPIDPRQHFDIEQQQDLLQEQEQQFQEQQLQQQQQQLQAYQNNQGMPSITGRLRTTSVSQHNRPTGGVKRTGLLGSNRADYTNTGVGLGMARDRRSGTVEGMNGGGAGGVGITNGVYTPRR